VRIPLDYYRILGLPIQATAEQLQQAHRDRTLQLPRREFSEVAIASRKQLLDEAYAVLSDPAQRSTYDASFLNRVYEPEHEKAETANGSTAESVLVASDDLYSPSIDIQDNQLVGALLILLELGEYELVLRLAQPLLNSGNLAFNSGRFGQPDVVRPDIVLTVALAQLELGREQWQQGQYEYAAASLEVGQGLLSREELFAGVRGEMQTDLYKLRPYRILELVSLPESHQTQRRQGLALLQEMLQDRGGIDGTGDDQSGLNVDDFLRFIQQLRGYLTAAEQHTLFEAEARRPSAVATYLAVYALLARGFAYRQPALIRRAKSLLLKLGTRQDVHLEQAICSLLLGQTEEASRALELSQEYESLAFIREHSQGSPDLLPGLCLYGERWLQNEVFPHFRDLAQQRAALKDYFADPQVQAYLEELPSEPEEQEALSSRSFSNLATVGRSNSAVSSRSLYERGSVPNYGGAGTATLEPTDASANAPLPTAERISQLSPEGRLAPKGRRGSGGRDSGLSMSRLHSLSSMRGRRSFRLDRLLFLIAMGAVGLGILWLLWSWIASAFNPGPTLEGEQLSISTNAPPIAIPDPTASPAPATADPNAPLNNDTARAVVQEWLDAKVAAMGSTHDTQKLSQVLTNQALVERQQFAESAKQSGTYDVLSHSGLTVSKVEVSPTDSNQAVVEATVVETTTPHAGGQPGATTADRVTVRYSLIKQDGRWQIQAIEPLGSEPAEVNTSGSTTPPEATTTPTTTNTAPSPTVEPTNPATGDPNSTVGPSPINPTGSNTDPSRAPTSSP
jgi:hypothetical protein